MYLHKSTYLYEFDFAFRSTYIFGRILSSNQSLLVDSTFIANLTERRGFSEPR